MTRSSDAQLTQIQAPVGLAVLRHVERVERMTRLAVEGSREWQRAYDLAYPAILRQAEEQQRAVDSFVEGANRWFRAYERAVPAAWEQLGQAQKVVRLMSEQLEKQQRAYDLAHPAILKQLERQQQSVDMLMRGFVPSQTQSPELDRIFAITQLTQVAQGLGPRWEGHAREWENKLLTQAMTVEDVAQALEMVAHNVAETPETGPSSAEEEWRQVRHALFAVFVLQLLINYCTPELIKVGVPAEHISTLKDAVSAAVPVAAKVLARPRQN